MSRTSYQCPVCGVAMFLGRAEDVPMLGCGRCGGQWLDTAGTQRVVSGLLSEQAKAMARAASGRATGTGDPQRGYREPAPGTRARSCPICGEGLRSKVIAGVNIEIDICERDGSWFDAHELERLAKHFELQAAIVEAEAAEAIRELDEATRAAQRAEWGRDILAGSLIRWGLP